MKVLLELRNVELTIHNGPLGMQFGHLAPNYFEISQSATDLVVKQRRDIRLARGYYPRVYLTVPHRAEISLSNLGGNLLVSDLIARELAVNLAEGDIWVQCSRIDRLQLHSDRGEVKLRKVKVAHHAAISAQNGGIAIKSSIEAGQGYTVKIGDGLIRAYNQLQSQINSQLIRQGRPHWYITCEHGLVNIS